jgi:CRISPR system Cascade subunit CasC
MKYLEMHILQSFPVACLNRDDLNSPKTAIFGGIQRARVSSQSWKRAIREMAAELLPAYFAAKRSRLIMTSVSDRLRTKGVNREHAEMLSKAMAHYLGKLDPKDAYKVKTLMFLSPNEFDKLAEILLHLHEEKKTALYEAFAHITPEDLGKEEENADGDRDEEIDESAKQKRNKNAPKAMTARQFTQLVTKLFKTPVKNAFKGGFNKDAADIALFGRMVANDHSLTVEGAAMFGHALSTHKVDNEIDFFSAVDDLQPKEEAGAGMTGTLEFNSATYYRFAALNLDMLEDKDHLGELSPEERKDVVRAFVKATLKAVPGARKNSMNATTLPGFVLGIVRDKGHPVQLVNAFEKPLRVNGGKGFFEISIAALKNEYDRINTTWDLKADELACTTIPEKKLAEFLDEVIAHVD